VGPNLPAVLLPVMLRRFQSSVRINVGPNLPRRHGGKQAMPMFQSSVRINVGPNSTLLRPRRLWLQFQSSVRINVGPNMDMSEQLAAALASFNPP